MRPLPFNLSASCETQRHRPLQTPMQRSIPESSPGKRVVTTSRDRYSGRHARVCIQYEASSAAIRSGRRVFVAVKTTGVYCRPVCPARTPLPAMCGSIAAPGGGARGFRPCLRCRPRSGAVLPGVEGTRTMVERALALIEQGALDRDGVTALADRLGIRPRAICRGCLPNISMPRRSSRAVASVQRGQRLLDCIDLPIAEVAARAGFSNPRRMSAAFAALRPPPISIPQQEPAQDIVEFPKRSPMPDLRHSQCGA